MNSAATKRENQKARPDPLLHKRRYRRLLVVAGFSIALVSVIPLVIMTLINYHQYKEAFHTEMIRPIARYTSNAKQALESALSERLSAMSLVVREKSLEDLTNQQKLKRLFINMKQAFGGFIDLGLIDADGRMVSYVGPYRLKGKNYKGHNWFNAVNLRGAYISDVFMGYRNFPHFVMAVRHDSDSDEAYMLRATIDTEMLNRNIFGLEPQMASDAFIVNHQGVLQTPSRFYGSVLQYCPLPMPQHSPNAEVLEMADEKGEPVVMGYAYIERSPFVVMELSRPGAMQESWLSLRRELLVFLGISILIVLGVVFWGTRYMVNSIRDVDIKRATVFHKMEYTNKLAAIGRLGAGVAHEINNPLAIISEKAGLLKDLASMSEKPLPREKIVELIDSVLNSVGRCSAITRRLLGFAKQIDVRHEKINLELLCREVLAFLDKEAGYRDISINFDIPENLPTIESDRGQLQQVFLNIINNAFAAVEDGGKIVISMEEIDVGNVAVSITDDGMGIPEENLEQLFEPFFTTKKGFGTGLGLSITYGIVEKLGGQIKVKSKLGEGTCFTIVLPVLQSSV